MVLLFVAPVSEKLRQKDHHGFEASMAYRERPCLNNSKVDTGLQKIVNGTFREGEGDNGLYGFPLFLCEPFQAVVR